MASVVFCSALAAAQGTPHDDKLYDEVRIKLAHDRDVGKNAIDVVVKNGGDVTLRGKVAKESEKTKAERLARKVKGVKSVTNQLVVEAR